ncbi:hypothetical protein [Mesorhizobium sp. B3-2-1]|uniref:hypothetical protein n=1 Tax=Mesorhizobium sp. B3-2-1 TaxID=2589891 RepID=UPI001FEDBA92|nr:hypothetical protein [Mesorhizobium sp. B3-2-1]
MAKTSLLLSCLVVVFFAAFAATHLFINWRNGKSVSGQVEMDTLDRVQEPNPLNSPQKPASVPQLSEGKVQVGGDWAIICPHSTEDINLTLLLASDGKAQQARKFDCWKVDHGETLIILDVAGEYAYVATTKFLISKGWTLSKWLGPTDPVTDLYDLMNQQKALQSR